VLLTDNELAALEGNAETATQCKEDTLKIREECREGDKVSSPVAEPMERAAFRAEAEAFLAANARLKQKESMWEVNFETDPDEAAREFETGRAWQRTMFEHGFAGLTYPTEFGGRGGEPWMEQVFAEEAASYEASAGFVAATIAMLGPTLMKWGTDAQRETLLPRLLAGEDAWCQLFSEPGAGSDLASLGCRALLDGDEFIVSGQKVWNSAAQWCTHGMLLVRTDPDAPKHRGVTFLLVRMDSPGINVRPLVQATGAQHFNEVFLDEVRIPVANVLGDINDGWHVARTVLTNESALIGGGIRASTYDKLHALAVIFDQTENKVIRQQLAASYTSERVQAFVSERIMAAIRRRETPPVDPAILKLSAALNAAFNGNLAMAIAGVGALKGDEVGRWAQATLLSRYSISIGGGTNEVQRNNLAERALGLPRQTRDDHERSWKDVPHG
jgi:alkylation response protein AidB-like acyl-CoA dehydrogenase